MATEIIKRRPRGPQSRSSSAPTSTPTFPWLLLLIASLSSMAAVTMAKIGFQKDLSMDADFPPPVYQADPNIPVGHMRPLGWQRRPDGAVEQVEGAVSTIEFYHSFVDTDTPVVMDKALPNTAPIFDSWKDDAYILKQYGQVEVSVRVKTGRNKGKVLTQAQTMTMKKFLSEYKYEEWYLSSVVPVEMMEEIPLPACVRCGTISERLWSSQLWMSSGGTSSRVHSHDDHLLHCVLFGRRDFILVEPKHKKGFDFVPDYSGAVGGHSDINTEMIDMFKYPQVSRVPWTWASLRAGDCIFVPAGYVHQVRSYGRSVSVTIEFSPLKNFDDTGCVLDDDEFAPLSQAVFLKTLDTGIVKMTNRNLNADDVRNLLMCLVGKGNDLTFKQFEHFYSGLAANATMKAHTARQAFDVVTTYKNQMSVTESNLLGLSPKELGKLGEMINGLHKKEKAQNKARTKEEF